MEESITAYQGKFFSVTLQSQLGSTNYGWCLTSMPKEVILVGQINEPANNLPQGYVGGLVNQMFYFIAITAPKKQPIELEFGLCCLTQSPSEVTPFKYEEQVKVAVTVVPSNELSEHKFVKYSENAAVYSPESNPDLASLLYGYPPILKYGYPCSSANDCATLKYGYPCSMNDCATLKYGYPPLFKYGYPPVVKYGYPPILKYGYPCCQDE